MKKAKFTSIIIIIILAAAGIYLNRSYAHIYSKFDQLARPQPYQQAMENKINIIKYAALGDSLTYGMGAQSQAQSFPSLLAQKLSNSTTAVEVINWGVPGAMATDLLREPVAEAVKAQPQIITLFVGANEIHNHVAKAVYRKNLSEIIQILSEKTSAKIYLINLPYLGTDDLILPPYDLYFDNRTKEFNKIVESVAEQYGLPLIDVYQTKATFQGDRAYYSSDEFHPSAKGYELWANLIYDQLQ